MFEKNGRFVAVFFVLSLVSLLGFTTFITMGCEKSGKAPTPVEEAAPMTVDATPVPVVTPPAAPETAMDVADPTSQMSLDATPVAPAPVPAPAAPVPAPAK